MLKWAPWVPEEDYVLRYEVGRGTSYADIASLLGRTKSAIMNRAGKLRLTETRNGTSLSRKRLKRARKFYRQGGSATKIQQETGVSYTTFQEWVTDEDKKARFDYLTSPHCQPPCTGALEPTKQVREGRRDWVCKDCGRVYRFPLRGKVFG